MSTKSKKHHVYHLVDPNDRTVRYVGKTETPKPRLAAHIQDAREHDNTAKKRWIRGLLAKGQAPVMIIVATYREEHLARLRESHECHAHLATILNIHDPARGARDLKKTG